MNLFTSLIQILSFLGSPSGAAVVKKLEAIGADFGAVINAFVSHAGLAAIEAALVKLLDDVTAQNAIKAQNAKSAG